MREHKYRAWDKKTKQMARVFAIVYSDFQIEAGCDDDLGDPEVDEGVWIKVYLEVAHRDFKDVELMQYTGLKDKNGKEIYEGDVLRIFDRNYEVKQVIKNGCKAFIDYGYPDEHNGPCDGWSEVIGNIYENPELMEANT